MNESIEKIHKLSFNIILHAGNGKSDAIEAITLAKMYKFNEAKEKVEHAREQLVKAHQVQSTLLQEEASGNKIDFTIMLVHAQDHLMTAITVKDLAKEFIDLYHAIQVLEDKTNEH